jgi:hypothetical protein
VEVINVDSDSDDADAQTVTRRDDSDGDAYGDDEAIHDGNEAAHDIHKADHGDHRATHDGGDDAALSADDEGVINVTTAVAPTLTTVPPQARPLACTNVALRTLSAGIGTTRPHSRAGGRRGRATWCRTTKGTRCAG